MMICKGDTSMCPLKLNICCGTCDRFEICNDACSMADIKIATSKDCEDLEEVKDELEAIQSSNAMVTLTDVTCKIKELEETQKKLKADLLKQMEKYGVKSIKNDRITISYTAPTTRKTFDKDAFKKAHPEIDLDDYQKISNVSASVKIMVK